MTNKKCILKNNNYLLSLLSLPKFYLKNNILTFYSFI